MESKTTLKDIAQEVGLSVASVSLVLNGKPCRISEENKRRIKQVAQKRNYVPNQTARNLVLRRSRTIGLIIPDIENYYFASLASNIERYVRRAGYALLLTSSDGMDGADVNLSNMLVQQGVDGFIIIASDLAMIDEERSEAFNSIPVPYVMVDRTCPEIACDKVAGDNVYGGYIATKYLLDLGHENIAGIFNTKQLMNGIERFQGYRKALEERGLEVSQDLVFESDYSIKQASQVAPLIANSHATAVLSTSNLFSLALLKYFHEKKIKVPYDMSIISYDNSTSEVLFEPSLTTVDQHMEKLAESSVNILIERIQGKRGPYKNILVEPELLIKESCAHV